MSYTIGLQVVNNDGSKVSGLFILGDYGFPYILRFEDGNKRRQTIGLDDQLFVFETSAAAVKAVRHFSKLYRYEFRYRAKMAKIPVYEFKFFPVKIEGGIFSKKFALGEKLKLNQNVGGILYRIKYKESVAEDVVQCANIMDEYSYTSISTEDVDDTLKSLLSSFDDEEVLDVSASEVDDLARDVYIDDTFDTAYKADGNTMGDNVAKLIVDVLEYMYPDYDLGNVPDRVLDTLHNMLEDGLL